MIECGYCNLNNNVVYRGKHWTLIFHKQDYLGRCVLVTNRHVDNFSKLTNEELIDLRYMLSAFEKELKELFNCTMLNWSCNMNNAFLDENPNPHVHIHIRPRYKNEVNVNETTYKDAKFGSHYDRSALIQFNDETVKYIFDKIENNFPKYYIE